MRPGTNMRSELGKARGLGSAHDGTHHFWLQRVTAVANVPLVMFMLWFVIAHPHNHQCTEKSVLRRGHDPRHCLDVLAHEAGFADGD
jgi:hypothetical protein